jgi:hypothetical protein
MSIEKSLYAAPEGIESLMPETEEGDRALKLRLLTLKR